MVSNLARFVPPELRTKKSLQKNLGVSAGLTTNRHDLRRPSEEGQGYRSGPTCKRLPDDTRRARPSHQRNPLAWPNHYVRKLRGKNRPGHDGRMPRPALGEIKKVPPAGAQRQGKY